MSNEPRQPAGQPQSPLTVLHGSNAFKELDELHTKLQHLSATAHVLNVAAFGEGQGVVLDPASLQDYTTYLSAEVEEIRELVRNWVSAKTLQGS